MRTTRSLTLTFALLGAACATEGPSTENHWINQPDPSSPGDLGSDAGVAPTAPQAQRNLPCDIAPILDARCGLCHKASLAAGAPMPLVTQADFHALDPDTGKPFYELVNERIHDTAEPMPPVSQDPLEEGELAVLTAWLEQGAPRGEGSCGPGSAPEFPEADASTPPTTPPEVEGIVYDPIRPEDCEESIELRAFDPQNPSEGFLVSTSQVNSYECFVFEVPYDVKMHGLSIEPIIDDERVVHHWLVYDQAGSTGQNAYYNCAGQHPAAQLLAGWAPGRGATLMPRDVGLRLPQKGSATFVLEVHYNNSARISGVRDRSGARVCATSKLKRNEAAIHWLGTEAIVLLPGKGQAVGTCTAPKQATILNSWPHMHELGTHMKVDLTRNGGNTTTLLDKPFSFDDQRSYDTPVVLAPGDKLRTTCSYDNQDARVVGFGTDSEAEMCYNFVLAYPAGVLTSGFSLTVTDSTCIDPL